MPHGSYYEMDDIKQCLNDNSENRYYLVKDSILSHWIEIK